MYFLFRNFRNNQPAPCLSQASKVVSLLMSISWKGGKKYNFSLKGHENFFLHFLFFFSTKKNYKNENLNEKSEIFILSLSKYGKFSVLISSFILRKMTFFLSCILFILSSLLNKFFNFNFLVFLLFFFFFVYLIKNTNIYWT